MPESSTSSEILTRPKHRFDAASKRDIDPVVWGEIQPFFDDGLGLYIFGGIGTGKTHLCYAIKKEIKSSSSAIISVTDLFLKIKSTFNKEDGSGSQTEEEIINELSDIDSGWSVPINVLFLDDLGIEKPSEWAQQTLYTIIDRRYRDYKQTVFTSNLSLDDLSDRLGDRIPSRIAEMCKVIKLNGKDRRLTRK